MADPFEVVPGDGASEAPHGRASHEGDTPWGMSLGARPEVLGRAARADCTILITGETGVGKGHLARWLHRRSRRAEAPFIPVNCGAIPETLIDSHLFGHLRGAFSGATSDHPGLVRAAAGGTLFLDEICELPPSAQTRLLRLLQDGEVQPVGHPRPIVVDIRIIAATNRNPHDAVERREFREDLLYRLDVIHFEVPPLRRRLADLPALISRFNAEFAERYERPPLRFTPAASDHLMAQPWRGNIRELRTVVERLYVLGRSDVIDREELIELGRLTAKDASPCDLDGARLDEVRRILARTGGSVSRTAALFGVHRSTIYRWLNER